MSSAPSGRDVLAGERAIAAMKTAPPMLASSIGRRLSACGSIAHEENGATKRSSGDAGVGHKEELGGLGLGLAGGVHP